MQKALNALTYGALKTSHVASIVGKRCRAKPLQCKRFVQFVLGQNVGSNICNFSS